MVIMGAKKVDINYMHFQNIRRASKRIGYGKRELTDGGKERNRRHTLRTSQKAALPVRCPAFLQSQSDSFPSFFLPSTFRACF